MRHLIALSLIKKDAGFNLVEMILVTVLIGIVSAVAVPNLLDSQREMKAKQAFTQVRSALLEAQANANRKSTDCVVTFTPGTGTYTISSSTDGCVLEPFTIDTDVVSLTKDDFATAPTNISFDFTGKTNNASTLWIARKTFSGNIMEDLGKCVVVSSIGMVRSGINDGAGNCDNIANSKYDDRN